MRPAPLPAAFFARDALVVARALLGCLLIHRHPRGLLIGKIVETEAYDESERASHSYAGKTPRNAVMFGAPGHAYVYRSYGIHWCMNTVCGDDGHGAAVLLRAVEPTEGLALMAELRQTTRPIDLARGPGRLCQAMGIDASFNGHSLTATPLWIAAADEPPSARTVRATRRIGISKAKSLPWRFCVKDNRYVSGPRGWR